MVFTIIYIIFLAQCVFLYLYNELKYPVDKFIELALLFVTSQQLKQDVIHYTPLICKQRFLQVNSIYRLALLSNHVSNTRYCIFHVSVRDRLIYVLF